VEVAIPRSLEALVRRKVEEGHYSTEAEVVADALRLIQVRDEVVALKRDRLRDALDRGYEDAAAGRLIQLETDDQIDELFAGLSEGRR
jgi:putative addiction module CopG family antidote